MVEQVMDFIEGYDKEIGEAIKAECGRQRRNLELIASENIVSEPVMAGRCAAYIHARPLPNRLKSFQNLNLICSVLLSHVI